MMDYDYVGLMHNFDVHHVKLVDCQKNRLDSMVDERSFAGMMDIFYDDSDECLNVSLMSQQDFCLDLEVFDRMMAVGVVRNEDNGFVARISGRYEGLCRRLCWIRFPCPVNKIFRD